MRVGDGLPEHQSLIHLVTILVLNQTLIVTRNGDQEQETVHVLETVNPLLPFRPLAADIEHSIRQLAEVEDRLGNARGSKSRPEEILVCWHIGLVPDSVKIFAKAVDNRVSFEYPCAVGVAKR